MAKEKNDLGVAQLRGQALALVNLCKESKIGKPDAKSWNKKVSNVVHGIIARFLPKSLWAAFKERSRQVTGEGFALEHDDQHNQGELALAGVCYVMAAQNQVQGRLGQAELARVPEQWPFEHA